MTNPQIATILDDGTYGQREMTDEEYAEVLAMGTPEEPASEIER
jgi:hypothetical protein